MRSRLLLAPFAAFLLSAQEPALTAPEKLFQESLTNVTLEGFYTQGGFALLQNPSKFNGLV